jgi:hypothetical protein
MSDHDVIIDWQLGQDNNNWWNMICSDIMQVFGLPGNRYTTHVNTEFMLFKFKSKKDALLCRILLSDRVDK